MDPMTMAMLGQGLGSAGGAGGQIAGGLLTSGMGPKARDMVNPVYDPALDPLNQGANFNIMSGLGFGNINTMPSVVQQLIGRMQGASIDEKTKRRAERSISDIEKVYQRLSSRPGGENRQGTAFEEAFNRAKNTGRLEQTMTRLGLSKQDLERQFADNLNYQADMQKLRDAGLDRVNMDTVTSRYNAANDASQLIGQASRFGQTGEAGGVIQSLLGRDDRQLNKLRDRAEMLYNFGVQPPGAMFEEVSDATLDQNLRVLEQALGISGSIQAALGGYTSAASGQQAGSLNAATIAANQAQAANQLRQQMQQSKADSIGNAIGAASSSLGSGISNMGMMSSMFGGGSPSTAGPQNSLGQFSGSVMSGGSSFGSGTPSWNSAMGGLSGTRNGIPNVNYGSFFNQ